MTLAQVLFVNGGLTFHTPPTQMIASRYIIHQLFLLFRFVLFYGPVASFPQEEEKRKRNQNLLLDTVRKNKKAES